MTTLKLTKPQRKGLLAVAEGRIWVWKGGGWGQSRSRPRSQIIRNDVLDRLLDLKLIAIQSELDSAETRGVIYTAAGNEALFKIK